MSIAPGFAKVVTSTTLIRPSDTTAYASGDLVANSTGAGSVAAITIGGATLNAKSCVRIDGLQLTKSSTNTTNASFRVHVYNAAPASITNGDNVAWLTSKAGYVGAYDVTTDRQFTDGARGTGVPVTGSSRLIPVNSGDTLHVLLEARGAYTPASAETFVVDIEAYRF